MSKYEALLIFSLVGRLLLSNFLFLCSDGSEASGNGGLRAWDGASNRQEQLRRLPGQEEAVDERSARFTGKELSGRDKTGP